MFIRVEATSESVHAERTVIHMSSYGLAACFGLVFRELGQFCAPHQRGALGVIFVVGYGTVSNEFDRLVDYE